jgi:hypothetical protein
LGTQWALSPRSQSEMCVSRPDIHNLRVTPGDSAATGVIGDLQIVQLHTRRGCLNSSGSLSVIVGVAPQFLLNYPYVRISAVAIK